VVDLFKEKDDQLIMVLYRLLLLVTAVGDMANSLAGNSFFAELYPILSFSLDLHVFFFTFLTSISFDHALLLDLLISNETRFLEYLT